MPEKTLSHSKRMKPLALSHYCDSELWIMLKEQTLKFIQGLYLGNLYVCDW